MSGKRRDAHFAHAVEALKARGLALAWCQYLGDDPELITATLRRTFASRDIVFCFGGIGATPDDYTRRCAARAAGVELRRHPDAVAEIEARFGADAYPRRVLMAEIPQGSRIVPNPYNRIPGFSLGRHHFLPGFPEMAWPMLDWVLDTEYPQLHHPAPQVEAAIVVPDAMETPLLDLMNDCVARFPDLRLFCLPTLGGPSCQRRIELGVKGDPTKVAPAIEFLKEGVAALGYRWTEPATADKRPSGS